jgi:hypothetical protein
VHLKSILENLSNGLFYLLEKQFPKENISICLFRQLIILEQWRVGGVFSRYHGLIDLFGQTLYSPSMVLLSHRRWLFNRNREEMKKILNYHSPIRLLINHSNEHIYYNHKISPGWRPRNTPHQDPSDVLNGSII